jgi:hypothetical protein
MQAMWRGLEWKPAAGVVDQVASNKWTMWLRRRVRDDLHLFFCLAGSEVPSSGKPFSVSTPRSSTLCAHTTF